MNSQSAIADNYISGSNTTTEELEQALLVNNALGPVGALGGTKSAVKKFAKGVLKKTSINERLSAYVADNLFPDKYRKAIIKEIEQGEYEKSVDLIMNHTPRLNQTQREEICELIKEAAKQVADGIKIAENAAEERDKIEAKLGFKIGGHATARTLEQAIRERGGNVQNGKITNIGEDGEKLPTPETPAEKFLSKISTDVHDIAEGFLKLHEKNLNPESTAEQAGMSDLIDTGDIGILNGESMNITGGVKYTDQYEYTENGMVKMKRNDQGELEPDEQDSQTRETLKRRDEQDETQKGILGKLTGIGTSVLEFFGKKKEKKKPNVFEKILSVLGMGFSFLGGSKLFTALKVAGLATGAAYILGKSTGVVKTDENGNELHDEYGNPIFKTVGEVIGDKLSGIVIGIKDWIVKTAWPGIKNFFLGILPTVKKFVIDEFIPTAITGFKTVFGGVTDIAESIVDFATTKFIPALVTSFIDHIPDLAAAVGNSILEGLGWKKKEEKTEEVSPTAHTDGFQSQISKSSGTTSNNGVGGTFSRSGNSNSSTGSSQQYTISDSEIEEQLKNSTPYKNVKNKDLQQRIISSKEIKNNWFTSYNLPDGTSRTLGEILTTPGYTIGTTNTETITSDDLLSRPGILYVATGGDVNLTASSEKQAANTKTATKTQSEKVLTATAKTIFTKGQIGSGALRVAQAGVSVPHRVTQAIEKKFGAVGKYMSYVDKAAELGTLAPMKAVEFSNNMARAKAGGESTFEALKTASKDTFKTTKKQKKKGERLA